MKIIGKLLRKIEGVELRRHNNQYFVFDPFGYEEFDNWEEAWEYFYLRVEDLK